LPGGVAERAVWPGPAAAEHEALIIPAQVNYVGKVCDLHAAGYAFHGSSLVAVEIPAHDLALGAGARPGRGLRRASAATAA
ncbi:MAG TPA: hypothetical protein DGF30_06105, partial [Desulfomicrobium sp.]|nr:hypothetical protein [Desulfomicrobium sp.]